MTTAAVYGSLLPFSRCHGAFTRRGKCRHPMRASHGRKSRKLYVTGQVKDENWQVVVMEQPPPAAATSACTLPWETHCRNEQGAKPVPWETSIKAALVPRDVAGSTSLTLAAITVKSGGEHPRDRCVAGGGALDGGDRNRKPFRGIISLGSQPIEKILELPLMLSRAASSPSPLFIRLLCQGCCRRGEGPFKLRQNGNKASRPCTNRGNLISHTGHVGYRRAKQTTGEVTTTTTATTTTSPEQQWKIHRSIRRLSRNPEAPLRNKLPGCHTFVSGPRVEGEAVFIAVGQREDNAVVVVVVAVVEGGVRSVTAQ
ncbi:hypothetical protein O3P69_010499 [Scylla paramamosain]|uniref:Uncharacterized protein n=1 Tax=Scylla paramamosain TaxID=85552 RepID=A0AAW0TSZ6_SCYPA